VQARGDKVSGTWITSKASPVMYNGFMIDLCYMPVLSGETGNSTDNLYRAGVMVPSGAWKTGTFRIESFSTSPVEALGKLLNRLNAVNYWVK